MNSSGLLATVEALLQIGNGNNVAEALQAESWVLVIPSASLLATMSLNNDQASMKCTVIDNSAVKSLTSVANFVLYETTSEAMLFC